MLLKRMLCLLLTLCLLAPMAAMAEEAFEPMKKGSKGDSVKNVKLRLFELGYFHTSKLNGAYNDDMVKKVTAFQHNNGLAETGEVDAATHEALWADTAVSAYPNVETPAVLPEIDWPARDEEGYLLSGEPFLYEDDEGGKYLWLVENYTETVLGADENGEDKEYEDFDEHYVYYFKDAE